MDQTRVDKTDRIKAAVKQHFEETEAYQSFQLPWRHSRLTGILKR
jgi:hypothetical protein